jgi:hypothetical protein
VKKPALLQALRAIAGLLARGESSQALAAVRALAEQLGSLPLPRRLRPGDEVPGCPMRCRVTAGVCVRRQAKEPNWSAGRARFTPCIDACAVGRRVAALLSEGPQTAPPAPGSAPRARTAQGEGSSRRAAPTASRSVHPVTTGCQR